MADLDDFFAKKDRKKSKSVKKFATADELAKKLDDPKQQKSDVRPKKERPTQDGEEGNRGPAEEEWKEYEEPVKDYSGLKIQVLQGGAGGGGGGGHSDGSASDDAGLDNGRPRGAWNKTQVETAEVPPPPPVEEQPPPPVRNTAYVAPSSSRLRPLEQTRRNQTKHAPDINNDFSFPVLGAAGKKAAGWGGAPRSDRQPVALGNRFTSLPDDS